jgi:hypothetical protein
MFHYAHSFSMTSDQNIIYKDELETNSKSSKTVTSQRDCNDTKVKFYKSQASIPLMIFSAYHRYYRDLLKMSILLDEKIQSLYI